LRLAERNQDVLTREDVLLSRYADIIIEPGKCSLKLTISYDLLQKTDDDNRNNRIFVRKDEDEMKVHLKPSFCSAYIATVRPNIDAVEVIDELLGLEEGEPHMEDEIIIILVCFGTVAKEVDVLPHALSGGENIFQYDDAILYDTMVRLMSDFRCEEDGSEIH